MSEDITVSDDVYRMLKREAGDRRLDKVLRESIEDDRALADVAGEDILASNSPVKSDIRRMSSGQLSPGDNEDHRDTSLE